MTTIALGQAVDADQQHVAEPVGKKIRIISYGQKISNTCRHSVCSMGLRLGR
ncbi:MAG: hypothetical protein ACKVP1_05440 [Burkholderiaceae bacterium]